MDSDEGGNGRMPYIYTFDSMFWITLLGAFFGFLGLLTKSCLKSGCTQIKCGCIECKRTEEEIIDTPQGDDINIQL